MADFKSSADFTDRTMKEIRSYEEEMRNKGELVPALLFSKPMLLALCAGGFLFAILNYVGMISTLIFPTLCL